jgi:hypothetical protein
MERDTTSEPLRDYLSLTARSSTTRAPAYAPMETFARARVAQLGRYRESH